MGAGAGVHSVDKHLGRGELCSTTPLIVLSGNWSPIPFEVEASLAPSDVFAVPVLRAAFELFTRHLTGN